VSLTRKLALVVLFLLSMLLAVLLREFVHEAVIVPLAYLAWQVQAVYWAIPELVKWVLVIVLAAIGLFWQLVPEIGPSADRSTKLPRGKGSVEILALAIRKGRTSSYFKWQLANRLGRTARRLEYFQGRAAGGTEVASRVAAYFSAGVDHSFVDFPMPRYPFQTRGATPLDLDPAIAVDYLESQWEFDHGGHAKGL
jgi:hypothetical protein